MAAAKTRLIFPSAVCRTALLLLPSLAAYLLPGAGEAMIYDRPAILGGELWRLVTGNWVHFSAGHLLGDAFVLAVTASLSELRGYRHFPALCLLSALSIGLAMLLLLPDMARYGGLSGIAMAGAIYVGLHARRETGPWRALCLGMLLLATARLVLDLSIDHFAVIGTGNNSVVPVPLSHFVGAFCALAVHLWSRTTPG